MTTEEAIHRIKDCAAQMNARYKKTVFDEWAVINLIDSKNMFAMYSGPRRAEFQKEFLSDIRSLRADLVSGRHGVGDFEFTRHGSGTQFDAFMVLGEGLYLICNNTTQTMDIITHDSLWLNAQLPFAELSEAVRMNPVCQAVAA